MKVYLDTNIIVNEQYFRSTKIQAFLKISKFLGLEVVVPEIVVDETKGRFSKALTQEHKSLLKAKKQMSKMLDFDFAEISVEAEVQKFEEWLDELLKTYDVTVAPYPEISAKELVQNSYMGKKPFKEKGEGHKDFLVWHTIFNHLSSLPEPQEAYFLTDNIRDFCEKKDDSYLLHPDLAAQLEESGTSLEVIRQFGEFFEKKIIPQLSDVSPDDVPKLGKAELAKILEEILESELDLYSAYGLEGLHFCNDVTISVVGEMSVDEIQLMNVDEDEDEVLIEVNGTVLVEADGFMDKSSYYHAVDGELDGLHLTDGNWNDWVVAVCQTIDTPFELTLSYSKSDQSVTGHTLTLIDELGDDFY